MVETTFAGESGNNLFQYFLSFCISYEKKYGVKFKLHQRGNTFKKQDEYFIFNGLKLPFSIEGDLKNNDVLIFNDHVYDWNKVKEHNGKVLLNGFFQKYSYYRPYKSLIKDIIHKHNNVYDFNDKPGENDLVLHFRNYNHVKNVPISYYKELIESDDYDTVWLVSREVNDTIKTLLTKYKNTKVKMGGSANDFLFICNATNIGISQSTFSWWAAFISKANKIYFPLGTNNSYLWYENPPKERMNLFVNDEKRYIKKLIK